jgi:hypothetical protein
MDKRMREALRRIVRQARWLFGFVRAGEMQP